MSRSLKVLGIETSTARCQVALAENDQVLASAELAGGSRPTADLVPAIDELCRRASWPPRSLDLIAVDIGPGSYTGLRVGLTCAKTLAFASGAALAAVRSLDVTARNAAPGESLLEIAFDAARGQVYTARFRRSDAEWRAVHEISIVAADEWARRLDPAALVVGPALERYRVLIPSGVRVAEPALWWPRAAEVIQLGCRQFQSGPSPSYWMMEPIYMRPSAAEEKRGA